MKVDGVTYIETDVYDGLGFPAVVAFTAATGSISSHHAVADVTVTTEACP